MTSLLGAVLAEPSEVHENIMERQCKQLRLVPLTRGQLVNKCILVNIYIYHDSRLHMVPY